MESFIFWKCKYFIRSKYQFSVCVLHTKLWMTTKNWLQTQSRLRISETVTKPRPDDITLNRQSFRARQCDVCCGFSVGSDFSFRVHVNARRRHFHTLSGALSPHTAPSHYPACTGKWRWARGHVCGTRRTSKKTGVIEIFIVESGLGLVTKAGSGGGSYVWCCDNGKTEFR